MSTLTVQSSLISGIFLLPAMECEKFRHEAEAWLETDQL